MVLMIRTMMMMTVMTMMMMLTTLIGEKVQVFEIGGSMIRAQI